MTKRPNFADAIKTISDEARLACAGRPMVTITFATAIEEARFYDHLRTSLPGDYFMAILAMTKPNVQLAIDGVAVRLTSETKVDEYVRAHLK
jgi:hypothetical protein